MFYCIYFSIKWQKLNYGHIKLGLSIRHLPTLLCLIIDLKWFYFIRSCFLYSALYNTSSKYVSHVSGPAVCPRKYNLFHSNNFFKHENFYFLFCCNKKNIFWRKYDRIPIFNTKSWWTKNWLTEITDQHYFRPKIKCPNLFGLLIKKLVIKPILKTAKTFFKRLYLKKN